MRTQAAGLTALEDRQVPVQAKLAAAWTSFMFLYVYVDYFHLFKPGALEDIQRGVVFAFDISPSSIQMDTHAMRRAEGRSACRT